jgi:hypothetical protein
MAFVLNDRVLETSTTTGTAAFALLGAPTGYQNFSSGIGGSNTTYYAAFNTVENEWELGLGTLNAGATELTRTTIYSSSNSNNIVNFSAGTKNVFVTMPASQTLVPNNVDITGGAIDGTTIGGTTPAFATFTGNTIGDLGTDYSAPSAVPSAPPSNHVTVFGESNGGRIMPAFIGPSGLDSILQPHISRNKVLLVSPAGNSTTISIIGTAALTATGTATAANVAVTNVYTRMKKIEYLVTSAATTAVAGFHSTVAQYTLGGTSAFGGFHFICRFGPATGVTGVATRRLFVGMSSSVAAPTDVAIDSLTNMIGIGYDSNDTTFSVYYNDASGTATKTSLGATIAVPTADRTDMYEVVLFNPPNSNIITYQLLNLSNGVQITGTINSVDIPAATTLLSPRGFASVGGTSSVVGFGLSSLYIETDY